MSDSNRNVGNKMQFETQVQRFIHQKGAKNLAKDELRM